MGSTLKLCQLLCLSLGPVLSANLDPDITTSRPAANDAMVTMETALPLGDFHVDEDIISARERQIYEVVNYVILGTVIGLFGIVANIINIIIFYRQGLKTTVNVSLFALAISDLCSLLTLQWFNICVNPLFENADDLFPMMASEVIYLTAGIPHDCFARITCWITVYITAERCLCITFPLKIKQLITPTRTTVIISLIYILMMASFTPEYATAYIGWKYYASKNRTLLGLKFTSHRKQVEGLTFLLYGILGKLSFVAVVFFTVILVVVLRKKTIWRRKSIYGHQNSESISNRDKKTINMIIIIAIILIVCYTPGTILSLVTFFVPDFSIVGNYVNLFFAVWSFGFLFETINSSVNIFLYYKMSSKYRRSFCGMFSRCVKPDLTWKDTSSNNNASMRVMNESNSYSGLRQHESSY
ncbi:growth hormone secretagogue receptor type 1-like [Physella acuta]|uniref:growth hormone secretagogue receptor type 1-like n=1 Tax=Physella acuta TaxID=109671 RepID=UPI0027DC3121|nr:growth hormone secretagogue receptor type 1-like [Physella acuta]